MAESVVSPEQIAEYEKIYDEKVKTVLALIDDPNWKEEKKEEFITFYLRKDPSSSFSQVKSVVEVPLPPSKVAEFLKVVKKVDATTKPEDRDGCIERCTLNITDEATSTGFYYIVIESPSRFVTPRSILMFRKVVPIDDKYILLQFSVDNDAVHPKDSKYVRANMFFQANVVIPDPADPNKCKVIFVCHCDPCGSVPAMLYNTSAMKQGYAALRVRNGALAANQ